MTRTISKLFTKAVFTKAFCGAAMLAMLGCASLPASAGAYVSSKSGIKTLGYVDWSQFGPPGSIIQGGSVFTATHGLTGTVNAIQPGVQMKAVANKGISGVGPSDPPFAINGNEWDGNFADAENLLWTNSPGQGPITLTFDAPIQAVGAQIQTDYYGAFTVEMDVFHQGNLIAVFTQAGDSNNLGDGSAIFFGVADDIPEIDMVTYSILGCANDCADFAIDSLDIGVPNPVPEPGTLGLLASSVIAVGAGLRRRFI